MQGPEENISKKLTSSKKLKKKKNIVRIKKEYASIK